MLTSFSTALSALSATATAVDVVGNNLANLNTPGFKSSQLQFADLFYRNSDAGLGAGNPQEQIGAGVGTGGTFLNFQQGEARQKQQVREP